MAEGTFQPDWFSKPGDTLSKLLAQRSVSAMQLANQMGCEPSIVRGLLAGTVAIDERLAELLARAVGGSSEFWKARQARFESDLARVSHSVAPDKAKAWVKTLPLRQMAEAGWISQVNDRAAAIRQALSYFDVADPDEWEGKYTHFQNSFAFRTSAHFEAKMGAVAAWLRQGEIEAASILCSTWHPARFRAELENLRVLTKAKNPAYFIPKLRAVCARAGVAVVFVRAPAGCRASGASRFLPDAKRALIILSFRHLSDDHFWFSFFHEAGHLLLHGEQSTFVDGGGAAANKKEAEANAFAAGILVPVSRHDTMMNLRPRARDIIRFALSVGVSPGIVVGQMQHLKLIPPSKLNWLKRRYSWEQIQEAID